LSKVASIRKEIETKARPDDAWAAIADIGALHTRLVPGFVVDTKLEPGARVVTFGNGMVVREPIVTIDGTSRRLVWTAEGGRTTHYNASVQVFSHSDETTAVVWIADFLPDAMTGQIAAAMEAGLTVMKKTLDRLER
jgi:Polyketide cyclase / dehydrase and lipid transport